MKTNQLCVKKGWKSIVKIPISLVFSMFLLIGAYNPPTISAAAQQPVSLELTRATAEDAIKKIVETTRYRFSYVADDVKSIPLKNYSFRNGDIKSVMDYMLAGTHLRWHEEVGIIYISVKQEPVRTITGIVLDQDGRPLVGASVSVSGDKRGTITDANGHFRLTVELGKTLEVSSLGSEKQRIEVIGSKIHYEVTLTANAYKMDAVTVTTGYQEIDRKDMVGAYTVLDMDDILMPNYSTVDAMLQGQVAGLVVTNPSTRVGSSPTMTLRGTSTLLGTTSPLWVVDGVIQQDVEMFPTTNPMVASIDGNDLANIVGNSISWLNPHDIDKIVVLKDASATAIYGARASNGVIVVTTKRAKTDRILVNYSANTTVSMRPSYDNYNLMNSQERINFSKEAFDAYSFYLTLPLSQMHTYEGLLRLYLDKKITETQFIEQYKKLEVTNTDWLDLVGRTSFSHKHNVSVSGGTAMANYNASFNYDNSQGTEIGNDLESFSGRINLNMNANERLRINVSIAGTVRDVRGFAAGVNPLSYAIGTSRTIPAYDDKGEYLYYQKTGVYNYNRAETTANGFKYNILNEIENTYSKSKSTQLNATVNLNYSIIGDGSLKYEFVIGYTSNSRNSEAYADENTYYVAKNYRGYDYGAVTDATDPRFKASMLRYGGELFRNTTTTWSYNMQNKLLYSKLLGSNHRINGMAAFETRSTSTKYSDSVLFGYMRKRNGQIEPPPTMNDIVPITTGINVTNILVNTMYSQLKAPQPIVNYLSVFASAAYSYCDRYIVNLSFRNDWSNRFGQDVNRRFDPTYSIGLSWRLSEEEFAQALKPYLSTAQFRLTYGIQGNVQNNVGPELILSVPSLYSVYNQFASTITRLPNANLGWERTHTLDIGTNLGFFDDKINFDIDGYWRRSKPLASSKMTPENGTNYAIPQLGSVIENSGIEVTASFRPIKKDDMQLGMSINFSKNWNKVNRKVNDETQTVRTAQYLIGNKLKTGMLLEKGYSVDGFWVYAFDGLDPETGYPMLKYMDMEDYDKISDFLVYAGSKTPLMTAGININFSYKNFSIATGLSALLGGKTLLTNPYDAFINGYLPGPEVNLDNVLTERWKKPGDEAHTNIPAVFSGGTISLIDPSGYSNDIYSMWAASDVRLVSKSFLRCRTITFNWNVRPRFLENIGVRSLTLSGTLNNVFVIASSKFRGMDPETGSSIMPKSFSLGLNLSF